MVAHDNSLWDTLKTTESQLKQLIHTRESMALASNKEETSISIQSQKPQAVLRFRLHWKADRLLWEWMLEGGLITHQECLTTVEQTWTMLFCWSEWSMEPGKSRILGELLGERRDLSDWLLETLVVFALLLPFIRIDFISYLFLKDYLGLVLDIGLGFICFAF